MKRILLTFAIISAVAGSLGITSSAMADGGGTNQGGCTTNDCR